MASKGKGKGKASKIEQKTTKKKTAPQPQQSLALQYEGALDNTCFIDCMLKNGSKYMKARILGARLKFGIDPKAPKKEDSYDYYVHYEGENRRWDEWVNISRIKMTDELIPEEPKKQQKVKQNDFNEYDEHEGFDQDALNNHLEHTKFKTVESVRLGKNDMESWYYSPFPLNYQNVEKLYFCEYCMNFYILESEMQRHQKACILRSPPGDEIYRDDTGPISISMYEVDGKKNSVYAENLSYFSKLFLDHKNLYWNMDPFLFYILCENDDEGSHIVGYFSKDKDSKDNYNLSCILIFPLHQRKGYGKFLISFSYELSSIEDKVGTPERPLSDLGRKSYLSWWCQRIIQYIESKPEDYSFSVEEISRGTYILEKDILYTLEQKGLVKYQGGNSILLTDRNYLKKVFKEAGHPGIPVIRDNIHWIPYKVNWNREYNIRQPEYDPFRGSNYTNIFLKPSAIQQMNPHQNLASNSKKKTPSKKAAQKQAQSQLQTPQSKNVNGQDNQDGNQEEHLSSNQA
ncbi:hypothetical protein ABPG74_015075 [Tetrahymena malaccensis]